MTNRAGELIDFKLVTKTKLGVENQIAYTDQNVTFSEYSPSRIDGNNITSIYVGAEDSNKTANFTGYINLLTIYDIPFSATELLSSANRLPVKLSLIYEPNLVFNLLITDNNTAEYQNTVYEYSKYYHSYTINDTASSLQLRDLASDKISVCQFHIINVSLLF